MSTVERAIAGAAEADGGARPVVPPAETPPAADAGGSPAPVSLLGLPTPVAVRILSLSLIGRIRQAYRSFFETGDAERLHDLRVSVRRLRTLFRAYDGEVKGSVRRKDRRRLKTVATGTAALREMDVRFAWVDEVALEGHEFAAVERLRARAAEARVDEVVTVRKRLEADLRRLTRRLRKRLRRYTLELDGDGVVAWPVFAIALADTVTRLRQQLGEQLERVAGAEDEPRIHAARIAAKRLRYALEPVADTAAGAAVTAELVGLQDLLGRFLDLGVAVVALDQERASAHRGDNEALVAGLQGLLSRARAERAQLLAQVRAEWVEDAGRGRLAPLDTVVSEVLATAGASPPGAG